MACSFVVPTKFKKSSAQDSKPFDRRMSSLGRKTKWSRTSFSHRITSVTEGATVLRLFARLEAW